MSTQHHEHILEFRKCAQERKTNTHKSTHNGVKIKKYTSKSQQSRENKSVIVKLRLHPGHQCSTFMPGLNAIA